MNNVILTVEGYELKVRYSLLTSGKADDLKGTIEHFDSYPVPQQNNKKVTAQIRCETAFDNFLGWYGHTTKAFFTKMLNEGVNPHFAAGIMRAAQLDRD